MKTTINMFQNMKDAAPVKKLSGGTVGMIAAAIVVAAVVFGIFGFAFFQGRTLDSNIASVEEFIANSTVQQQSEEAAAMQNEIAAYQAYVYTSDSAYTQLTALVKFDSGIYRKILAVKPDRVTISGLSFKDGGLTIQCTTTDDLPPADFAQALDGSGVFSTVSYTGFSGNPTQGYVFTIVCTLPQGGAES